MCVQNLSTKKIFSLSNDIIDNNISILESILQYFFLLGPVFSQGEYIKKLF